MLKSKYVSELDKPLTAEGKEKIDRLINATPFLRPPNEHSRSKRDTSEVKEGADFKTFHLLRIFSLKTKQTVHYVTTFVLLQIRIKIAHVQ